MTQLAFSLLLPVSSKNQLSEVEALQIKFWDYRMHTMLARQRKLPRVVWLLTFELTLVYLEC